MPNPTRRTPVASHRRADIPAHRQGRASQRTRPRDRTSQTPHRHAQTPAQSTCQTRDTRARYQRRLRRSRTRRQGAWHRKHTRHTRRRRGRSPAHHTRPRHCRSPGSAAAHDRRKTSRVQRRWNRPASVVHTERGRTRRLPGKWPEASPLPPEAARQARYAASASPCRAHRGSPARQVPQAQHAAHP